MQDFLFPLISRLPFRSRAKPTSPPMGLFDRFRKPAELDGPIRSALVNLVMGVLRDKDGRIHVEDAISGAATIVAERCIDAAGDFSLRDHDLTPGSRAFSTRANELICGDVSEGGVLAVPAGSIVGTMRARLDAAVYADGEFPPLAGVFEHFAAHQGSAVDWGKAPLTVSTDNHPFLPPLRFGYETRAQVDEILKPLGTDKARCLRLATEALAELLAMVASAIDHQVALRIAIETINAMAKTAPMTVRAMQAAQQPQK